MRCDLCDGPILPGTRASQLQLRERSGGLAASYWFHEWCGYELQRLQPNLSGIPRMDLDAAP